MSVINNTKFGRKVLQGINEYTQIALGVVLASIGLKAFLLPNGFIDGGITGIAILLKTALGINISWALIILSLPFLVMAYIRLSRIMVFKSILSILSLALLLHLENFELVTEDKLLIAIFGGLFLGAGIGITIKNGAVLDGSEILGVYINKRFGVSVGSVILLFNVLLFGIATFVVSQETAMYSILAFLVTAKITDLTLQGFENYIGVMIVSKNYPELKEAITQELGSGMTVFDGVQGYGKHGKQEDFEVIQIVINRIEIIKIHRIVDQIDPTAFLIEYDVNQVKGGILRKFLPNLDVTKLKVV